MSTERRKALLQTLTVSNVCQDFVKPFQVHFNADACWIRFNWNVQSRLCHQDTQSQRFKSRCLSSSVGTCRTPPHLSESGQIEQTDTCDGHDCLGHGDGELKRLRPWPWGTDPGVFLFGFDGVEWLDQSVDRQLVIIGECYVSTLDPEIRED